MTIIKNIIENKYFVTFITIVIIVNAITLGLETSKNIKAEYGIYSVSYTHLTLPTK